MRHLFLMCCLASAPPAFAKGLVRTAGFYNSNTTGDSKTSRMVIDAHFAYVREKGWAFGGLYQQDSLGAGEGTVKTTSFGPNVGWFTRKEFGYYAVATYFFSSKRDDNYTGSGVQADVGYRFQLRRISYALQISYKSFSYGLTSGTAAKLSVSHVDPYFSVWFEI